MDTQSGRRFGKVIGIPLERLLYVDLFEFGNGLIEQNATVEHFSDQ